LQEKLRASCLPRQLKKRKENRTNLKPATPRLLVQSAAGVLVAWLVEDCAVFKAPGFGYADPKLRSSVTLGQYGPAHANNPPQGVMTPITPALVRAQQQSRSSTVGPEVQRLLGEPVALTIGAGDIIGIVVYEYPELLPQAGAVVAQSVDPRVSAVHKFYCQR
jgi:polysaccharide biosynthesis/export protein